MFDKKNLVLIIAGVLLLIVGFFCLATGPAENPISLTVAPLILVVAYMVVIPLGILLGGKKQNKE